MSKKKKKASKEELFERYKLVVAARNFHYSNFQKWLTYFYVANAALFVGYQHLEGMKIPLLILGVVSGLLLYWSSKGYYFWNINFIMLVNYYEKELLGWKKNERVYSMFANKKEQNNFFRPYSGANFSTSKIAVFFGFIIASSWLTLLLYQVFQKVECIDTIASSESLNILLLFFVSATLVTILTALFGVSEKHFLWSNTNPLHDLQIDQEKVK